MSSMLYLVVALVAIGVAVWQFLEFTRQPANNVSYIPIIIAIISAIVALVCGALFMSSRVNKTEEIHITE